MKTKPFTYDQDKVKELRMKLIFAVLDVLDEKPEIERWSPFKKEMVIKMSPRLLPQLQEVTGKDGEELFPSPIYGGKSVSHEVPRHNSDKKDIQPEEAN